MQVNTDLDAGSDPLSRYLILTVRSVGKKGKTPRIRFGPSRLVFVKYWLDLKKIKPIKKESEIHQKPTQLGVNVEEGLLEQRIVLEMTVTDSRDHDEDESISTIRHLHLMAPFIDCHSSQLKL
jgi:hypothetical protein